MDDPGPHYRSLVDVAEQLRSGACSAVELVSAELERIAALDGQLGSYALVTAELALEQARRADLELGRGNVRSPLHGVPIAVKDVVDVAGLPTVAGLPMRAGTVAAEDAGVYRKLRAAGAVLLGKLHLTEAAYGEYRLPFVSPVNPWRIDRWPGASSSGSGVAVAAGLCFGALGSDTGGSIRTPSAVNGVTGIRPTWGRVSRSGVFELAGSLDQIGPMARTAADAGAILAVIAGADPADPTASLLPVQDYASQLSHDLAGVRLGIDPSWIGDGLEPQVRDAIADAVRALVRVGAEVREIALPDLDPVVPDWFVITCVEAAQAHRDTYPSRRDEYGPAFGHALMTGNGVSAVEYDELLKRRAQFRGRLSATFTEVDLIITPVMSFTTPSVARMAEMDDELIKGLHRFTCPFSMTANPTITVPAGFTSDRLPIGVQLVGRHFDEALLVQAGNAFQRITNWHEQHPPL